MASKNFKQIVKEVDINKVEEYHDTSHSAKDSLVGIRDKKFVRFESDVFQELIDEIINNPNCHYVTYVNDLIKSGYIPKHVSVLKKCDNGDRSNDEYGLGHFKDGVGRDGR